MAFGVERATLVAAWIGAVALRPDTGRLRAIGADPAGALVAGGADRVVGDLASAGLWVACVWVALASAAVAAARLPGAAGALARAVAHCVAPRVMRRALAAALGAGIALTPALAIADPSPQPGTSVAWPLSSDPVPPPAWPVGDPTTTPSPAPDPAPTAPQSPAGADVVVRPGDTLWSVAAAALGPGAQPADIAAAWPQWYRANADSIGEDPNLIRPGITLHAPAQGDQP